MGFVYILQNVSTGRFYIGSTNDIERRLVEHQKGKTRTTRVLGTYTLVYKEQYDSIDEARLREKKLKSYKSRKYLEWLISKDSN